MESGNLYLILIFIFFAIFFIISLLSQFKSLVKWWVEYSNKSSGVKTEVTNLTFVTYRWWGIAGILLGIAGMLLSIFVRRI